MIRKLYLATALLVLCVIAAPLPVKAYDPFSGVCGGNNPDSAVCSSQSQEAANGNTDPLTGSNGILAHITNIIAFVAGAAAIIVIIVSALRLATSGSDVSTGSRTDTDVEDARRGIGGAVVGLAIIVLGRILILYVLDKL